jgi:hypothetical protein
VLARNDSAGRATVLNGPSGRLVHGFHARDLTLVTFEIECLDAGASFFSPKNVTIPWR